MKTASKLAAPLAVQLPASPWQREALADPLLPLVREGKLPGATYDQAFDAIEETQPGAYYPAEAVQEYLRANWTILLAAAAPLASAESKMGRPTLLTPELFAQIEQLAEAGSKTLRFTPSSASGSKRGPTG